MMGWLFPKVKFLLREVHGLMQAEGLKAPTSLNEEVIGAIFSGVLSSSFAGEATFAVLSVIVDEFSMATTSLSSLDCLLESSFRALVTLSGGVVWDGDLALLLGSLVLPLGGDVAVDEKSGGGRLSVSSSTEFHGPLLPLSFMRRIKSETPYLTLEL